MVAGNPKRHATWREVTAVVGSLLLIGATGTTLLIARNNRDAIDVDRLTMSQRASFSQPGDSTVYAIAAGQLEHLEAQEADRWRLTGYATVGSMLAALGLGLMGLSFRRTASQ